MIAKCRTQIENLTGNMNAVDFAEMVRQICTRRAMTFADADAMTDGDRYRQMADDYCRLERLMFEVTNQMELETTA